MAQTRGEELFQQVRADILNGALAPSEKLSLVNLSKRYGASSGVLREVLPRLVERGLATWEGQLGFRVLNVSLDDLRELTETRIFVEGEALRRSILAGGVAWEVGVVSATHLLLRTPRTSGGVISDDWLSAHARFHHALIDGCPNRRFIEIAAQLRDTAEVYRCWAREGYERAQVDIDAEHRELSDLALARREDAATEALARHINETTEMLIRSVNEKVDHA